MPPTATHGLNHKIEEIVKSMDAKRSDPKAPRNVNLRQHLRDEYDGLEAEQLYSELNIDPTRTTVSELMGDDETKWLMPEIVRDGVYRGMGLAQREALNAFYEAMASLAPVTSEGG